MVQEISDADFKKEVEDHKGIVLIDFWAPWCGPCQMAAPILEKVSKEMGDKIKLVKMNVDENQQTASKFGIMSIPTFVFMKDGKEVERKTGVQNEEAIKGDIEKLVRK